MTAVTQFDLFGSKLGYGEPRHTERQGPAAQSRSPRTLSTLPYSAPPIPSSQRQLSTLRKRLIRRDDMFGRRAFYEGLSYGSGLAASSSARRSILGPLVNARLMAKRVDLGGRRLLDVGGSGATRARCRWHQYRASRHYDTNQSQQAGIVIWLPTTGCNRCAGTSVCGPRPKSRPAASRAAFWGEPVAAATCSAWPPVTPKETFLTSTPSKAQHRPMSARAPTHNVDCPGNSLHSGELFAEGPHLRGAVRVRPQPRGPHSQQLQANMVHFGYRTLRCPKLLQPSGFPASELSSATLSFDGVDVKKGRGRDGHC